MTRLVRFLRFLHSPTLWSVAAHGAAGVGFAGANLLLARALPEAQYALFTLVTALVNLAVSLAPLGLDGLVLRQRLAPGPRLLGRVLGAATSVALGFVVAGCIDYTELDAELLALLGISTLAGGALMVAAAQFQSDQQFCRSLILVQSPNAILLVAALIAVALADRTAAFPLLLSTLGVVAAAAVGWWWVLRRPMTAEPPVEAALPWGEALAFAGVQASGLMLVQLDRLLSPHVLPIRELATYGVLAAIAGSLFRVLQMGVGYSLVPRLRAAPDVPARRTLLAHEAALATVIVVLGSALIWFATPFVEHWFLAGKYHLSETLVLAALTAGIAKILNAFSRSAVTALGDARELRLVNAAGWISVAIAIGAAAYGARFGLAGVVYGVGLGWLVRALSAFALTLRHLRLPPP